MILASTALLVLSCNTEEKSNTETAENLPPKLAKLKLQPGFEAEHLYSPGDREEGSWVAMTFDDKGRLITSDQYGALYRMKIPAIGSENLTPEIEKLKIQTGEQVAGFYHSDGICSGTSLCFQ